MAKKLEELTDREIAETTLVYMKQTAKNTGTLKTLAIIYAVISILGALVVLMSM